MRIGALAALALVCSGPALAEPIPLPAIAGPQTICFKYSAFRLAAGERAEGLEMGLEGLSLDVSGPRGKFTIAESEIWRAPDDPGASVLKRDDLTAFKDRASGETRYGIWGKTFFSAGRSVLLIWLSGPALRGDAADRELIDRFRIGDAGKFDCARRYVYTMDADGPEDR